MDLFNYCVLCNPDKNWLELEFMSENDEPINGLIVTITSNYSTKVLTGKTSGGKVLFGNIAAGVWRASVSIDTLLTEVEKYASRKEGVESTVSTRASSEVGAAHQNQKEYKLVTIGDLWDSPPKEDDNFLIAHHQGVDINALKSQPGFSLRHNKTYVFEIKALRSYIPFIVDTDEFSLINSYTFSLLAKLAYATDVLDLDDKSTTGSSGSIGTVISCFKKKQKPIQTASMPVNWLVKEVPYSQALSFKYYNPKDDGAEAYLLFNKEIAILGVRGTEPYFGNGKIMFKNHTTLDADITYIHDLINPEPLLQTLVNKVSKAITSSGAEDVMSDMNAAQIPIEKFGGTYVHRGFYNYVSKLWNNLIEKEIQNNHKHKYFYVCGHSLGAAGALILSALIKELLPTNLLHLYTYGSPRTGTKSFVERYKDIVHHRHVNDHDGVTQVPMKWVNTNPDKGSIFATLVTGMLEDGDDDNYHHHGELTQLLTYDEPRQILLTPRQTHLAFFDAIKSANEDAFSLLDELDFPLLDLLNDHDMNGYILNLNRLLRESFLLTLEEQYSSAINFMDNEVNRLSDILHKKKLDPMFYSASLLIASFRIKAQIDVINNRISNCLKISSELKQLMVNPQLRPTKKLLVANQVSLETIKTQIIQDEK